MRLHFDRHELAGSLGDMGTLLPLALGLILINGLDATAVFVTCGLFYVLSGLYFRITVPVQPMKMISAYAIVSALEPLQISAAGLWMSAILIVLALLGGINWIRQLVPQPTVRGVQLTTGVLLFNQGLRFILGETKFQQLQHSAEPFLSVSAIGPLPIGIILGVGAIIVIFLLLSNRRTPAALVVVGLGAIAGLCLGGWRLFNDFHVGIHLPRFLPYGIPDASIWILGLTTLALPQLPMTLGNAIIAQADLTRSYFGEAEARRSSPKALALSMGLANLVTGLLGGMPLCHGAGGLAAHYRFGARSAGSNLMIGGVLLALGLLLGDRAVAVFGLLPLSVLGALLCFAGAQLALMILDVNRRTDLFVVIAMLAVSLVTNLAVGFAVGLIVTYFFKFTKVEI